MNEKPRLCIGALVFNKEDILLLESPKWEGRYIIPSGHVELMETIEDAVQREVLEETGLEVYNLQFLAFIEFINPQQYHKKNLHFVGMQYYCQSKKRKAKLNKEATSYKWVLPQKALSLSLEQGTRMSLELYLKINAYRK